LQSVVRLLEKLHLRKKLLPSDVKVIASIPRLKYLIVEDLAEGAGSSIALFKNLTHLDVGWDKGLVEALSVIGANPRSLVLRGMGIENIGVIAEHCPGLKYLDVDIENAIELVKYVLKKLAKLKVNGKSVRLGTDWEGF
jgi:hypothetical protein